MKRRTTNYTREIIALFVFSALCSRLIVGAWRDLPLELFNDPYGLPFWRHWGPLITVVILACLVSIAIIRIAILLRHRVPYGHCPSCGSELEPGTPNCSTCNANIHRDKNAHEKRSTRGGLWRGAVSFVFWTLLFVMTLSLDWNLNVTSSAFYVGDGFKISIDNGECSYWHRTADYFPGRPTPPSVVRDVAEAAAMDRDPVSINPNENSHFQLGWFSKESDNDWAWYAVLGDTSRQARIVKALEKTNSLSLQSLTFKGFRVSVPLWVPTLVFLVLAILIRYLHRAFPVGCCQTCGYDLDSVAGPACPECGTPKSESTYGVPTRWRE